MRPVVADLGCGAGEKSYRLSQFPVDVVAIDNLAVPLNFARRFVASGNGTKGALSLVQGDMIGLPLRDGTLDGAHDYLAFLHVMREDWEGYIRSVHAKLKPGAPLLIVTFSASDADFYGVPVRTRVDHGLVFGGALSGDPVRAAHLINSYFCFASESELRLAFCQYFDVVQMSELPHPLAASSDDHHQRKLWHALMRNR
jgi:SAM-dependent methyltransferase